MLTSPAEDAKSMPLLSGKTIVTSTLSIVLAIAGRSGLGQDAPQVNLIPRMRRVPEQHPASIRMDVKMVMIPANVTDRYDRPILDLRKEDFHLFEGENEQRIESFALDQAPVSVGIVFDCSGSMKNKIDKSFAAVRQFLKTSMPGDEFFLVEFSDVPKVLLRFTQDPDEVAANLNSIHPLGWTAMFDAIYLAANQMRSAKNPRRALLVLSDGGDNDSRYSAGEAMNMLREADVRVFAIGLFDNASFLRKAAADTGGNVMVVRNINDLPDAVEKLSTQIRSQYLLGYYPVQSENDGKFHRVKLIVSRTVEGLKLHTSWRHGYYAPY